MDTSISPKHSDTTNSSSRKVGKFSNLHLSYAEEDGDGMMTGVSSMESMRDSADMNDSYTSEDRNGHSEGRYGSSSGKSNVHGHSRGRGSNHNKQSVEFVNHNVTLKKRNQMTQSMDYAVTGSGTFKKGIFSINRKWKDLKLEDLEQTTMLGQGSSGVVYLARHKNKDLPPIAVKNISAFDREKRNQILKELAALYDSSSPYLVGFYGAFYDEGSISMALEYMEGGSLKDVIDNICLQETPQSTNTPLSTTMFSPLSAVSSTSSSMYQPSKRCALPEGILSKISEQVLLGLQYLHKERHMVHRDVKPSNILMNRHGIFKLTDFGVSAQLENTMAACKTFVGTVTYMSPERLEGKVYSYASDVWSLGITVYECISGQFPFQKEDGSKPLSGFWELLTYIKKSHPNLSPQDGYSEEVSDFVKKCLQKNPTDRPSVNQLLGHPFITKYRDRGAREYEEWYSHVLDMMQRKQKSLAMTKDETSDLIERKIMQLDL